MKKVKDETTAIEEEEHSDDTRENIHKKFAKS